MNEIKKVSIRINVGAYNAYRNMQNRPHYAIAEYVDNAIQSSLDNNLTLLESNPDYICRIFINISPEDDFIEIIDNAAGINSSDFIRAFEPANIPLNNSGLHEFGMGLKIASVWLADRYSVTSKAIGEEVERTVLFDLREVIKNKKEILSVQEISADPREHYTKIKLTGLSKNAPSGRGSSIVSIKNHLSSIYRKFIVDKTIQIMFNGEKLEYEHPEILESNYYQDSEGEKKIWKESINFESGPYKVKGFIALLAQMKNGDSGFSLFRRGRVIKGSHDEKYKTKILSGQAGSPLDKRLFGEFELEGFNVSFDKGSFIEMEDFEYLLGIIKKEIVSNNSENIFKQGQNYRKSSKADRKKVIKDTLKKLKKDSFQEKTRDQLNRKVSSIETTPLDKQIKVKPKNKLDNIVESIEWQSNQYNFKIEFIDQSGVDMLQLHMIDNDHYQWLGIINLGHHFLSKFGLVNNQDQLEPIIHLIKSFFIAEVISRNQGTIHGGFIRMNINKIL